VAEIQGISDRGLAVFAFAIYHQLESGRRVTHVVREDGAGHHADAEAIQELQRLGLVHVHYDRVGFTAEGEAILDQVLAAIRRAAARPNPLNGNAPRVERDGKRV
jgi:hypothetical protein